MTDSSASIFPLLGESDCTKTFGDQSLSETRRLCPANPGTLKMDNVPAEIEHNL